MKLKAFLVICRNKPDFKLGEKLKLNDGIEDCDYIELSKEENYDLFHEEFNSALERSISIHRSLKQRGHMLDEYKKEYLIITSTRYIVQGFFRV